MTWFNGLRHGFDWQTSRSMFYVWIIVFSRGLVMDRMGGHANEKRKDYLHWTWSFLSSGFNYFYDTFKEYKNATLRVGKRLQMMTSYKGPDQSQE